VSKLQKKVFMKNLNLKVNIEIILRTLKNM